MVGIDDFFFIFGDFSEFLAKLLWSKLMLFIVNSLYFLSYIHKIFYCWYEFVICVVQKFVIMIRCKINFDIIWYSVIFAANLYLLLFFWSSDIFTYIMTMLFYSTLKLLIHIYVFCCLLRLCKWLLTIGKGQDLG